MPAVLLAALSPAAAQISSPASAPAGPGALKLSIADGKALAILARSAMLEFVRNRTPAERQDVPAALAALAQLDYPVAVTLRTGGQIVSQTVRNGRDVRRSVISAAIASLRSPSLPDRITPKVIESLTIEVEAIGPVAEAQPDQLARLYAPGLTGVQLRAGEQFGYALPSASYESGLGFKQMQALCQVQIQPTGPEALPSSWGLFNTRRFVGLPDGTTLWLYRGKLLSLPQNITPVQLRQAAQAIGSYLLANQVNGRLGTADAPATLVDHLYATYALAKLSRTLEKPLDLSPQLKYAQARLKKEGTKAYLETENANDQLKAAALYVIASREAAAQTPDTVRDDLLRTMVAALEDSLPARLDGKDAKATRMDMYVACRALNEAVGKEPATAPRVAKLRENLSALGDDEPLAALWKSWAGLPAEANVLPVKADAPLDEEGGYLLGAEQTPQTLVTALKALDLARAAGAASRPAQAQLLAARRFCYQMIYKPHEALFAAKPDDWVGAVRATPAEQGTSLLACASALEALLAQDAK